MPGVPVARPASGQQRGLAPPNAGASPPTPEGPASSSASEAQQLAIERLTPVLFRLLGVRDAAPGSDADRHADRRRAGEPRSRVEAPCRDASTLGARQEKGQATGSAAKRIASSQA